MKTGLAIIASLALALTIFPTAAWAEEEKAPEASVTGGTISGYENKDGDILIFKGIPYAAAPVGENRWKAPQPVEAWEGVRKCTEYSAAAMQAEQAPFFMWTDEFIIDTSLGYSEDCLYLNVWAPREAEEAPVIVFIHGGGNNSGGASCDVYDGEGIAKKGAVYVSLNYRVGIFGFLASSALSEEDPDGISGNYAIKDQIAALKWVQENIAAFGGDPENVTIIGQSAGCDDVNMLTISPEAAGLFKNAVAESYDNLIYEGQNVSLAEKEAEGDAAFDGRSLEEMRELDAADVMALEGISINFSIDDKYVIGQYADVLKEGKGNDVNTISGMVPGDDLMFGSFLTSSSIFTQLMGMELDPTTVEDYETCVAERFGDAAEDFLALYPAESDEAIPALLQQIDNDYMIALMETNAALRSLNGSASHYVYFFDHVMPGEEAELWGSFHTADVPYFLNHFSEARADYWTDEDYALGEAMSTCLVNIAFTGDPNGDDLPAWEAYAGEYTYMNFGDAAEPSALSAEKEAWFKAYFAGIFDI